MSRRKSLVIASRVKRAIVAHAVRDRPQECCGLLLGDRQGIHFAVPMANITASATRYRVDDAAHLELRRVVRRFAPPLAVAGVYHSHPAGGALPSPTDLEEAMYPDWAYLIIGMASRRPVVRAFRIREGAASEYSIRWGT